MNEKNTLALIKAAPLLYRLHGTDSGWPIKYGFSCGDGWFEILLDLSRKIEPELQAMRDAGTPIEELPCALQVKEKFGGMRFYVDRQTEQWLDWTREAEAEAFKTCERCGAPASMHRRGFFLQTLCPACAKREQFVPAELESPEEELPGPPGMRIRVAPLLKTVEKRPTLKGEARAAFLAARPLLLLNPRSPTNIEIAFSRETRPIIERMADRMEAELKRLVDTGLPFAALPVVRRIAVHKKTGLFVDIEPGTLPREAEVEINAAIIDASAALSGKE